MAISYIGIDNLKSNVSMDNPLPINIGSSVTADIVFQNAATTIVAGTIFMVGGYKTLTVEIYGTSTSRTVAFMGRGISGANRSIMGVKLSDFSTAISTTGTGELWQFDITGLHSVFMDLQAVIGGNVTVQGRVVA